MRGRVTKKIADKFLVDGQLCVARGGLKENGIFVGDIVEYNNEEKIIEKVCERKNLFIRPPLANLDRMIIVISPVPKPDFVLVDKIIAFCVKNEVKPILCVNKTDVLDEKLKEKIERVYSKILKICFVSAKNNDAEQLKKCLKGVCAFAGQSAVGKSSLINVLCKEEKELVGSLSRRVDRGKQTTRVCSIYELEKGVLVTDTAGFSKLDEGLLGIDERSLCNYFSEFLPYIAKCKFSSCSHIKEKDCEVKKAVSEGKISLERYESYKKIYESLKGRKNYEKKG